jgi:hypothetical protein
MRRRAHFIRKPVENIFEKVMAQTGKIWYAGKE